MVTPSDALALLWGEIENTTIALRIPGLVGAEQPEPERLIVHWHGPVDARITELVDASGCAVEIRPAPFPADALHAAARALVAVPGVWQAGFGRDFGSVHAVAHPGTLHSPGGAAVRDAVAACAPVPVTVEEREGGTVALGRRW